MSTNAPAHPRHLLERRGRPPFTGRPRAFTIVELLVVIGLVVLLVGITLQITAQSPTVDPMTGEFIRYTVTSQVALRESL